MNNKSKQLLIAFVVFVLVFFLTQSWISQEVDSYKPKATKNYIVAKGNITAGSTIREGMTEIKKRVPVDFAPKGAYEESELEAIRGQVVNVDIAPGDYIMQGYSSTQASVKNKLSEQLSGGNLRAVSLPVDETNSLARSILAGDHIDIIYNFQIAGVPQKMSTVLLQNIPVVATGTYSVSEQDSNGGGGERARRYNSLTLSLTPVDALRLSYARQAGQITIMLRSNDNTDSMEYHAITGVEDILSAADKQRVAEALKARAQQQASQVMGAADDKLKDQIRQVLEQKRQQQIQSPK